jgi:hypothetical protein
MRALAQVLVLGVGFLALGVACSGDEAVTDAGAGASGPSTGVGCIPGEELCDGQDNDCDGETDEDCACTQGQTQDCYSGDPDLLGIGECRQGTQTCDAQGEWGECVGEGVSVPEVCDGLDNNCDGQNDEGFGEVTCGVGACQNTAEECIDGEPNPCTPNPPNPQGETCDGTDDDCDGQVDENCPCTQGQMQDCYTGPPNTQGVGLCQAGTQLCDSSGQWGQCNGSVVPTVEQCNGDDDDCDGTVDDGNPDGGSVCTTGQSGICAAGIQQCQNGNLTCVQNLQPTNETCNGLDDDCDGPADEGNPGGGATCNTLQPGICAVGTTACQSGMLNCNPNQSPTAETCNGLDDDCDGPTDEGNPGGGGSCTTGLNGVCGAGTYNCIAGMVQCTQNTMPSAEVCDTLDNDCDGQYDEDFYGDQSNGNVDFPNVWSVQIPFMGSYFNQYPAHALGTVLGKLLPQNDQDWFTVEGQEQKSDVITDTPIKGKITLTSPAGKSYRACVCWSDATTYCNKDVATTVPTCITSTNGTPVNVTVNMEMAIAVTDIGYLDIQVLPLNASQYGCANYTLAWDVWE